MAALLSIVLEISAAVTSFVSQTQSTLAEYVPLFGNDVVFAGALGSAIALPILLVLLFSDWDSRLPPRMPILLPALLGKFSLAKEGPIEAVRQGYSKHGEIFRMKLFNQGITFLVGNDAHEVFFMAKDTDLAQREVYKFTVPVFGKNIVYDADPSVMIQQLKFVRTGLMGDVMMSYVPKIIAETEDYFAKWGQEGKVDLHECLSEVTILTASRCLLGQEIRENVQVEFAKHYKFLNDGMTHISVLFPNLPTAAHKKRDAARKDIARIFTRVIQERKQKQAQGAEKPSDYLQVLIDAKYRDDTSPTDDEITGLLLAALFAGQHTSAISSTWMGYLILSHPHIIPKLMAEQKEALAATGGQLNFESLSKMELLHAVMKEALRLFPPLVLLMRKVKTEKMYKGRIIPAGDIAVVCPPVAHRISSVFSNPEQFDPERFTVRHEGEGKHDFIAFGGGRHRCLGENFGFLQVKTIWSILLRKFDFELLHKEPPRVDYSSIVSGPGNNTQVIYRRKKIIQ